MQTTILALVFLGVTAASYFAYPVFGITVPKPYEPEPEPPAPLVAATVDKFVPPEPEPEPEPEVPVEPEPEPEMPVAGNTPKPATPEPEPAAPETPVADSDGFVAPTFQPIEKYVDDWKYIPPSVFPANITVNTDVICKSAIGGSTLRKGSPAVALSESDGILTIAPTETAPVRGEIAMEETDLKEVMIGMYDSWKERKVATAKAAYLYKQNASIRLAAAAKFSDSQKAGEAGERPSQQENGVVPVCINSMIAGQVADIKPNAIDKWGQVGFEEIDGEKYWVVNVSYKSKTLFGEIPTEAQALIRNNQVVKWIYTGSGELVP